jgi:hypothetical protein
MKKLSSLESRVKNKTKKKRLLYREAYIWDPSAKASSTLTSRQEIQKKNSSSQKLGVKNNSRKKIFIVQRSLHMEPIFQQCPQCYRGDRVLKEKTE